MSVGAVSTVCIGAGIGAGGVGFQYYQQQKLIELRKGSSPQFPPGKLVSHLGEETEKLKEWFEYQSKVYGITVGLREDGLRGVPCFSFLEHCFKTNPVNNSKEVVLIFFFDTW